MDTTVQEKVSPWVNFSQVLKKLDVLVKKSKTQHVNSTTELAEIKSFMFVYFRELRPSILGKKLETNILDGYFETLQNLSSKRSHRTSYIDLFKKINKKFLGLEIQKEYSIADPLLENKSSFNVSDVENKIYQTLHKIDPIISASYMQMLIDVNDPNKISFKGTFHELREVLREVLARLALDTEVIQSKDFKLEINCSKPTMRQKVLFIFNQRGSSKDEKDIAIASVTPIEVGDNAVAGLTRNVYESGSTSAHTSTASVRGHVVQLKMYLDAILCHLLEINR
jgi:hypothetical protein